MAATWSVGVPGSRAEAPLNTLASTFSPFRIARPTSTELSTGSPIKILLSSPAGTKRTRPGGRVSSVLLTGHSAARLWDLTFECHIDTRYVQKFYIETLCLKKGILDVGEREGGQQELEDKAE